MCKTHKRNFKIDLLSIYKTMSLSKADKAIIAETTLNFVMKLYKVMGDTCEDDVKGSEPGPTTFRWINKHDELFNERKVKELGDVGVVLINILGLSDKVVEAKLRINEL